MLLTTAILASACASTRIAHVGLLATGESLVTLVVSEDQEIVHRECQNALATGRVLGCHVSRPVLLPSGDTVRAIKIVRYTDALPSRMAFDIDAHELCHAIAGLQPIQDPCHADGAGMIQSSASRRRLTR